MSKVGYDINGLLQEAQIRWLRAAEVLFILQNHDKFKITQEHPQKPPSGSLFLFNKRVLRNFRKDGYSWRKKKDGRTVREAHERLKVGNVEALNCYYAHGDQNPSFQRRSYWKLDPAYEHIVLVHYRDISEGKASSASAQLASEPSSIFSPGPSSCTTQNRGSIINSPHQNSASPPALVEGSSEFISTENGIGSMADFPSSSGNDVSQILRSLEEELSLNEDSVEDIVPECQIYVLDQSPSLQHRTEYMTNNQSYVGNGGTSTYSNSYSLECMNANKESLSWNELLESSSKTSSGVEYQEKINSSLSSKAAEESEASLWLNFYGTDSRNGPVCLSQKVEEFEICDVKANGTSAVFYPTYEQDQLGMALDTDSSLTVSQEQKFTIHEISPEWGYAGEATKVCFKFYNVSQEQKFTIHEISPEWGYAGEATKIIVVGSFLCDPLESAWTCMIGDTELPVEIIKDGVFRCEAPPHSPGKVTLCITSGNRESCSQIRTFEYRTKASSCAHCNIFETEVTKSPEELLLLVRFAQMLLFDSSLQRADITDNGFHPMRETKADNGSWEHVIEALLVGGGTTSSTVDWLVQQLLMDKLQQWLSSRSQKANEQSERTLSKKEQGIIHMVAGLGFEWALSPILNHGVSVNFRDINGWTALHWASHFGREKMVAALLASGASAGAVTDPNSQDPVGKSPAAIAASSGHKGLAGYLSELALTSHLSSLTIGETELSKGSAEVQAEKTIDGIANEIVASSEDQVSLKHTLAAVVNAAQAAARIQAAFRAHSFKKRREMEAAAIVDEYDITAGESPELSAMSKKLSFRNTRDYNSAALSIQKKYRGWKGRKDFLSLRQKVIKIQAHVRGYQVRKNYIVLWAVSMLEKAVLRWRRKGVGLRGFRNVTEFIDGCEGDILKVFRKQKVDAAIAEAVSRVLSMVDCPDARRQYHRMIQRYSQAKAELSNTSEAAAPSTQIDVSDIQIDVSELENEDIRFY